MTKLWKTDPLYIILVKGISVLLSDAVGRFWNVNSLNQYILSIYPVYGLKTNAM